MTIRSLSLPVALLLATLSTEAVAGGAWNRKSDGYYLKVGPVFITADREYDIWGEPRTIFNDPARFREGSFGVTNFVFYGELGLNDWLTGVLSTQYMVAVREAKQLNGRDTSQSSSGLGDTWVSARVKLFPDEFGVAGAVTLGVKIPTGSARQEIPLGTGLVDYEAGLAFGRGFPVGPTSGYAQIGGGYRLRRDAGDEVTYQVEAGINLASTIMLQGIVDGVGTTSDLDAVAVDGQSGSAPMQFIADQSFLRWNVAFIYAATDLLDINIGFGDVVSGRNTLDAGSFSIGLSWKK